MQIRNGVYRGSKGFEGVEYHGGATMTWVDFAHLCFYLPDKVVGYYLAGADCLQPYYDRSFLYQGEITSLGKNSVTIIIDDPYKNDRIVFAGEILQDRLQLRKTRQSAPNDVLIDDIFEFVGP